MFEEIHYLKSMDPTTGNWRDLEWMDFNPSVLDKYGNMKRVRLSNDQISFIGTNGQIECGSTFHIINGKLMMRSNEFVYIPMKEREHWKKYLLPKENNDLR